MIVLNFDFKKNHAYKNCKNFIKSNFEASNNSELKTGKNDKMQISANRGRTTKLTWNSLGTLY